MGITKRLSYPAKINNYHNKTKKFPKSGTWNYYECVKGHIGEEPIFVHLKIEIIKTTYKYLTFIAKPTHYTEARVPIYNDWEFQYQNKYAGEQRVKILRNEDGVQYIDWFRQLYASQLHGDNFTWYIENENEELVYKNGVKIEQPASKETENVNVSTVVKKEESKEPETEVERLLKRVKELEEARKEDEEFIEYMTQLRDQWKSKYEKTVKKNDDIESITQWRDHWKNKYEKAVEKNGDEIEWKVKYYELKKSINDLIYE